MHLHCIEHFLNTHIDFQGSLNLFMGQKLAEHPKMLDVNTEMQYGQTFQKHLVSCVCVCVCMCVYLGS